MSRNRVIYIVKSAQNKETAVARAAASAVVGLRSFFFSFDWLPFLSAVCVKHGAEKQKKQNSQHAPAGGNTPPITIECVRSASQ